jgi:DNA modification methylase
VRWESNPRPLILPFTTVRAGRYGYVRVARGHKSRMKSAATKQSSSNDVGAVNDRPQGKNRANELSGSDWTRFSISVWSDIRFTTEERRLSHPAMFPTMLVERLIRCFTKQTDCVVLDPFLGSGSSLVAAKNMGKSGIGFDVYDRFLELARERLRQEHLFPTENADIVLHRADSREITKFVAANTVDFCVTSPPYWDILNQKRTADYKETRNYGDQQNDLGVLEDYEQFLGQLQEVFKQVYEVLKPGKYCVVNVMDLRKGPRFFPFHSDLAEKLTEIKFVLDDIIIWDRHQEYNNLRSLGYPYTFRVNKVHEFLMIFLKPKDNSLAAE